ncbi:MAG: DNA gyrase inhibitor YacG [Kofleriaceae bacterium]
MSAPPARVVRCPTCERVADPARRLAPFCSERCQQVDLGRWLAEEYRIPAAHVDVSEGGAPDDDG